MSSAAASDLSSSIALATAAPANAAPANAAPANATAKKTISKKKIINNEDNECQVCCSTLNKSSNKPVVCPFESCAYSACVSCVRTYLLANPLSTPHCMSCKKQFNNMFLVEKLSKIWTNEKYKPHISSVMLDIELSKLPESMEEAENRKTILNNKNKISDFYKEIRNIRDIIEQKKNKLLQDFENEFVMPNKQKITDIHNLIAHFENENENLQKNKIKRKTFTMPCAYNNCKGMLSTQYKCAICDNFTCKDCHEPRLEEHKCNPDNVATTEAIKKETRPCPSCNTRIYKIEGCDQMWCTSCKTPFSWTTGTIVPAGQRIHNPHAIDFMRQNRGAIIRAPGDVICGGIITPDQFTRLHDKFKNTIPFFKSLANDLKNHNQVFVEFFPSIKFNFPTPVPNVKDSDCIISVIFANLLALYRVAYEVSVNLLRESREISQAHRNYNEQRISFILDQYDKDAFASKIKRDNQQKNVHQDLSFIWEILSSFGIDLFLILYNAPICNGIDSAVRLFNLLFQKFHEFNALIKYVNKQLAIVSVAHSCSVPIIDYSFDSTHLQWFNVISEGIIDHWYIFQDGHKRSLFRSTMFSKVAMKRLLE
jgi:hypothetical protein